MVINKFSVRPKLKFRLTFQYMRCFAERRGAKYGRAKCNEWTAYTVLCAPSGTQGSESATGFVAKRRSHFFILIILLQRDFSLF